MPEELAPNCDLKCNLCYEKISSVCLLSPDWSKIEQFNSSLEGLKKHFKSKHGIVIKDG